MLRGDRAAAATALALAAVIVFPAVGRGALLRYDLVGVDHQPLTAAALGVDDTAARAVPSDLLVIGLGTVLPPAVVHSLLIVAALVIAGTGASRLARHCLGGGAAALAATVMYTWNAYVYGRLAIGQWALLLGYAALPWVVLATMRVARSDGSAGWRRSGGRPVSMPAGRRVAVAALVLAAAPAALGGVSAWSLAALVATSTALAARSVRTVLTVVSVFLVLALPWLMPTLLRPAPVAGDPDGVAAFALRSDTPLGPVGSALLLGGVWNRVAAVPGRDEVLGVVLPALLAAVALAGAGAVGWRAWRRPPAAGGADPVTLAGLGIAAVTGWVVALASAWSASRAGLEAGIEHVPALGLLRDAQKWLAPLALLEAVGLAAVARAAAHRAPPPAAVALAALAPVALLPALVGGLAGQLRPATYPGEWADVRALVDRDTSDGAVLVLPWASYRAFGWNGSRPSLDPASRAFDRPVVWNDDVVVGTTVVDGESAYADRVGAVLDAAGPLDEPLRATGVRFVLWERTQTPDASRVVARLGGQTVYDGRELLLVRLAGPVAPPRSAPLAPVVAGDVLTLIVVAVSVALVARGDRLVRARTLSSSGRRASS